jgi:hypothetical protein
MADIGARHMIAAKVQWLVFWEVIVGEARQKKSTKCRGRLEN